jgi:hypothetical protein
MVVLHFIARYENRYRLLSRRLYFETLVKGASAILNLLKLY